MSTQNKWQYPAFSSSSSRALLGFVTSGSASAVLGGGIAVGHCDAPRLHNSFSLMASLVPGGSSSRFVVLIQNPRSSIVFVARLIAIPMN